MLDIRPGHRHELIGWRRSTVLPHYWILVCDVTTPAGKSMVERIAIQTNGMVRVHD